MRKWLKRSATFILVPLTRWYLRKPRNYVYEGIKIRVSPGVFHPGLFSSTKFLLEFLRGQNLANSSLLELGCGTGLISIAVSKKGALVTACDLSLNAIENAEFNIRQNNASVECVHSDLFESLPNRRFDWIIINPPYYARSVQSEEQLAWHCGENFQYFHKLFDTLKGHLHDGTRVIMVLTLGCELDEIFSIAREHHFVFEQLREKNVLFDGKDYLYDIQFRQFI